MNGTVTSLNLARYKFKNSHFTNKLIVFSRPYIGYLIKGEARFIYEGKNFYATVGDLIYIAKGTAYYSYWTGYPEIDFYSVNFEFSEPKEMDCYRFQIIKSFPVERIRAMYEINETDRFMALSHFYGVLSELFSRLNVTKFSKNSASIAPAMEIMENRCSATLTVKELADACYCSESHFYAIFKSETGASPIQYKNNILIGQAVDYLKFTDLSIDEISALLGFSTSNYFRRVFFKVMNCNPNDFRKSKES